MTWHSFQFEILLRDLWHSSLSVDSDVEETETVSYRYCIVVTFSPRNFPVILRHSFNLSLFHWKIVFLESAFLLVLPVVCEFSAPNFHCTFLFHPCPPRPPTAPPPPPPAPCRLFFHQPSHPLGEKWWSEGSHSFSFFDTKIIQSRFRQKQDQPFLETKKFW